MILFDEQGRRVPRTGLWFAFEREHPLSERLQFTATYAAKYIRTRRWEGWELRMVYRALGTRVTVQLCTVGAGWRMSDPGKRFAKHQIAGMEMYALTRAPYL